MRAESLRLAALVDARWEEALDNAPLLRLREGVPVDRLPDAGFERAERQAIRDQRFLDSLRAIDPELLEPSERITLETLTWETRMAVEGHRFFWLRSALTPYSSAFRLYGQLFPQLPLETPEDLARYVELVEQVPAHVRSVRDHASGQFERGVVVSAANLEPVVGIVRAQAGSPDAGPFGLAEVRTRGLDADAVAAARERIAAVVSDSIAPALEDLARWLEGPYRERAPDGVGVSRYPDGRDYYLYLTRLHTTMEVTPEEVRDAGYELLADFRRRMAEIRDRIGWTGSAEEFHAHLRGDPRYFPRTPDEIGERLEAAAARMTGRMPDLFATSPDAPWAARRLAPELEPSMTYGFYAPPTSTEPHGIYFYNGSSLDERSWLGLTAISLHELLPGHHYQIARTLENEALPDYRRNSYYTAFSEGWGSYASFLGLEAGVFEDPYSEYGLYILESFLATRLVVDPGMNYFGMTLEEARAFMRENTLESETQIATESLRYSTDMPGQALAYQMGKRRLLELRADAQSRLGPSFDIRAFHETVLDQGSLPLVVLEGRVERWVEQSSGDRDDR
ncbi:MAG: DUF885 domain-containing protein [Gemmatimonadota bacterium]|nr:DUF885 domain-containing protein [Gemmatimonadota bacterium]